MRDRIVWAVFVLISIALPCSAWAEEENSERKTFSDKFLTLGTEEVDQYGGSDFVAFDRKQIKHQIKSFIPPLLRPAITQHAFVLPPRAASISVTQRFLSIDGDDFFRQGEPNEAVFADFSVDRQLTDFDLFYGFDLGREYLHGFTFRLNIPYYVSQTDGGVHPNGQQFITLENAGHTQNIGDIGLFLKKKLFDQGTRTFGLAVVGAVILPTGRNDETFGSDGRITAVRPAPPNAVVAEGFDALQKANVENGTWGDPRCFFTNFNAGNRDLCGGAPFSVPAANVEAFKPGEAKADEAFVGDFPFNNGVFGRFSGDGRLPTTLQPGTGSTSYLIGAFATRQFHPGDLIGRAAGHLGVTHRFVSESDGIDFGDTTTYFATLVKPVYKDFVAFDLSFIGFDKEDDRYAGKIPEPEVHTCTAGDVGLIPLCTQDNIGTQDVFLFELHDRPAFSGGFTGFAAPSIIFNPDPQLRASLSALFRVVEPDLGPAPKSVVRAAIEFTF